MMKRAGLVAATLSIFGSVAHAAELDKMFNKLEPAYTTMAVARACGLQARFGDALWQYAIGTVDQLEKVSRLPEQKLMEKRKRAEEEGKKVALIGACGSVFLAFQWLDVKRKAEAPVEPGKTTAIPAPAIGPAPASVPPSKSDSIDPVSPTPKQLIQEWLEANEDCRGGSGDDPETWKACDRRGEVREKLLTAGYCEATSKRSAPWVRCR